jgi:hypothetical protein
LVQSRPPAATDPAYLRLNLIEAEQQSQYGQSESTYDVTHGQHQRTLVHAHPEPINPHLDIIGTGEYEVMIREVHHRLKGQMASSTLACMYAPTGQGTYTLPPDRLRYLYSRFHHTQAHHINVFNKLKVKPFPEKLFHLVMRCTADTAHATTWSLPPASHQAICKHTTATTERFANPLDSHLDSERCWSPNKRDKVFGFKHDTYKCQWRGASVAVPPSQPHENTRHTICKDK